MIALFSFISQSAGKLRQMRLQNGDKVADNAKRILSPYYMPGSRWIDSMDAPGRPLSADQVRLLYQLVQQKQAPASLDADTSD